MNVDSALFNFIVCPIDKDFISLHNLGVEAHDIQWGQLDWDQGAVLIWNHPRTETVDIVVQELDKDFIVPTLDKDFIVGENDE